MMSNARLFIHPWIMDKFDIMDQGGSTCGDGNYEKQAKPNFVHNWFCKIRS